LKGDPVKRVAYAAEFPLCGILAGEGWVRAMIAACACPLAASARGEIAGAAAERVSAAGN